MKRIALKAVLTVIFLSLAFTAMADTIKTYTVSDGLLGRRISCVYQDTSGILWFGSEKGITRFDGMNFTRHQTSNGDERIGVLAIFQDKSGVMWVITEIGVLMWSGKGFNQMFKFHGLTSFFLDNEGNKWLGSESGIIILGEGLDEKDNDAIGDIKNVNALFQDNDSNVWIGTDNGAYMYDGRDVTRFTTKEGLAGNQINHIYEDADTIYFATNDGISYYNGVLWNSYRVASGLADNYTTSIVKDFRGKLWIGTKNGLSVYDESEASLYDSWKKMTTDDGLADNTITCLYLDGSANLWIGTKNGVTKLNISFDYLIKIQGVKEQLSAPVFYHKDKGLWFSMEDGVTSFSGSEFERLKEEDGMPGRALSVFYDPDDDKLFFGTDYGAVEYEGDRISTTHTPLPKKKVGRISDKGVFTYFEVFPEKDTGLVGKRVSAIAKDGDGDIWFATEKCLNRLSGTEWTTFTTEEGLISNFVNDILLSDDGTLYIATKGGISRWSDGGFLEPITDDDGLPHRDVRSLYKDSDGTLWFGTKMGVCSYDGEKITRKITMDDGLGGDVVSAIYQDANGFMWFATDGGLAKYDGMNISVYTASDGIWASEVLSIAQDDKGIMWFGTPYGIMRYLPDSAAPSSIVLNAPEEPIVMPKYTFEVTGADLNSRLKDLLFSYKLDDRSWTEFKPHKVFYADELKNGTHYFHVRVKDKALNVEDPPAAVTFQVNTRKFDIEIVDIKFISVFSVLYQYYNSIKDAKDFPVGTITLKNNFDKDIKVKINSFIKDYMDYSADTKATVKAKGVSEVPLRLEFNENILNAPSGHKKVNITLQYYLHGENKENELNTSLMVYDKNKITWDDPRKIGAFVTVGEAIVTNFVRKVIQTYKDESKESIIYGNLIRAMAIFDALGAYGIRYIADPTNPYAGLHSKMSAIDTLRFPKQTLELKSGDCDDCVVLYCAMLENIGIDTAMIDTYDHLFMMFDVGLKRKDIKQITTDESIVYIDDDDNVWIPVEATLFGKTFSRAWESGARRYQRSPNKDIYYLKDSWEKYKPAEITSTKEEIAGIVVPDKSAIDLIYKKDVSEQEGKLLYNIIAKYEEMIRTDPSDVQAHNSLGIVHGKNGYLDKAA